jgi:CBS domain containing-hemolysin-like protein
LDAYAHILLAAIGALILGIFLLSLAEAALVAVSRVRLRRLAEGGDRRAIAVLALIESPMFISAIIVAINVLVITISCLTTLLVLRSRHPALGDNAIRLLVLGAILVVAEITPKNIGASYPTSISRWVVGPVGALTWLLSPIVSAVTAAGNLVLRGAGVRELHEGHFITQDDLRAAVDVGEEEEVLEPDEGEMFDTALAMAETSVRRIMVPRVDVVALDASATVDEALTAVQDSGFSRIPVYEGHIDRVVGVLYATELLRALRSGDGEGKTARNLMREAIKIAETTPIDEVLQQMRERQVHFAVVIGDQGGTEGIVTIEDILEELVGEIEDEHDIPGEEIQRVNANEALVDPKARIEEVNEALDAVVPGDQHETIAGYVAGQIGRIPDVGEIIRLGDLEITVQGDREAPRLRVRRLTDPSDCEGGDG